MQSCFQCLFQNCVNILPLPIEELDEVITFMFRSVAQPTAKDMKQTPMLARWRYILAALEWLKINHSDYANVQISQENLKLYPEESPPVTIDYRSSIVNKHKESTSVLRSLHCPTCSYRTFRNLIGL